MGGAHWEEHCSDLQVWRWGCEGNRVCWAAVLFELAYVSYQKIWRDRIKQHICRTLGTAFTEQKSMASNTGITESWKKFEKGCTDDRLTQSVTITI